MEPWRRRVIYYFSILVTVVVVSTLAYRYGMSVYEGRHYSLAHSLQVVVESLTMTGYGSDSPWTTWQMNLFVVAINSVGIVLIFLALPVFLLPAIEHAMTTDAPRAVDEGLSDHVIIATHTPQVEVLISELESWDVEYVIVEPDQEIATSLFKDGYDVIHAEVDDVDGLERANLASAKALVADVSDEKDASIVLSAREISETVRIVSVVADPDRASYHELAGADVVLSPRPLLGERLAKVVTTGVTTNLGEDVEVGEDFTIAELLVQYGSDLAGNTLAESGLRERTGVNVIGAWFRGEFETPAPPERRLVPGSVLLVTGHEQQLEELEKMAAAEVRRFNRGKTIVVGHGLVGQAVTDALEESGFDYTVVDADPDREPDVLGTASDPDTLIEAGIDSAQSVILAIPDDVETEFSTLVTRDANSKVAIAARAEETNSARKMYRAGADYVLAIETVVGRMIASAVLEDEDVIAMDTQVEVVKTRAPGLEGKTLEEADVRARTGCTVVAVERNGSVITDLGPEFMVQADDELVVAGTDEGTNRFTKLHG